MSAAKITRDVFKLNSNKWVPQWPSCKDIAETNS